MLSRSPPSSGRHSTDTPRVNLVDPLDEHGPGLARTAGRGAVVSALTPDALTPCPSPEYGRGEIITPCPSPRPWVHGASGEGRLSPPAPLPVGEGILLAVASAAFRRRPRALLEHQP